LRSQTKYSWKTTSIPDDNSSFFFPFLLVQNFPHNLPLCDPSSIAPLDVGARGGMKYKEKRISSPTILSSRYYINVIENYKSFYTFRPGKQAYATGSWRERRTAECNGDSYVAIEQGGEEMKEGWGDDRRRVNCQCWANIIMHHCWRSDTVLRPLFF
jgi:hypothetical protein